MAADVTGVLLAWRRLDNLHPIIAGMLEAGMHEVIVWSNRSRGTTHTIRDMLRGWFGHANVIVFGSDANLYTGGRYAAAELANTPLVATCDDDCLVSNWDELVEAAECTQRIAANIKPGHYEHYVRAGRWTHVYQGGVAYEALVGWGAAFPKSTIRRLDLYLRKHHIDNLFDRKADRLFTILQNREHTLLQRNVRDLPGATGDEALYRMADHWEMNRLAQQRAIEILEEEAAKCTES
jgi:hypothetical protein